MSCIRETMMVAVLLTGPGLFAAGNPGVSMAAEIVHGRSKAVMHARQQGKVRSYELTTNVPLRDNRPKDQRLVFSESDSHPVVRSGNLMFDGLYAMAVHEAVEDSVSEIKDYAYSHGDAFRLDAFQTGEKWSYVWTRDLAYAVHLALAGFDPKRSESSLLFKASALKSSVAGEFRNQMIQDTGSGGSWPVSTDRVVWALGAWETLKFLKGEERTSFLKQIYPILRDTIELDRKLVYNPSDGLYRGEQSFLDWREQTYPGWTKDNVLVIAMSKALSVNALNCFLLSMAAECAQKMNAQEEAARYAEWAANLKASVNKHFYEPDTGLYSTYLLSDGLCSVRVRRYDLLGESLAILFDVADAEQAKRMIENVPVGPHGPPVVWPQERSVPIYHNQGIWPFVTAYWVKAARKAGNAAAVTYGARSLQRLAAFNLSNMENFDFVSGLAEVENRALNGPVINSRRQLWSVAGYLSMVQDIVFGLETSWAGIRFRPAVTAEMRNELFASSNVIELQNFTYLNTRNTIRVHLPPANRRRGFFAVQGVTLNGKPVGNGFVPAENLGPDNIWEIRLDASVSAPDGGSIHFVDVDNDRMLYGPLQPQWEPGGIVNEKGMPVLRYSHPRADSGEVAFNIYRDGRLVAERIRQTRWVDVNAEDDSSASHCYTVEAVDVQSGNVSYLAPFRRHCTGLSHHVFPAKEMKNRGGKLVSSHHFADWGKPEDELRTRPFEVAGGGRYTVRTEFSNGSGPVNTGITCAVKKLEVMEAGSDVVVASGYLVMPQSGTWDRWDLSTPVSAVLEAGKKYILCIREDGCSQNMSYLKKNDLYTAWPGGGECGYNYVNIAAVHVEQVSSARSAPALLSSQ